MSALEIRPSNFKYELKKLINNEKFLASAITMPYKKKIFSYVKVNDKISKYSKSINFIIKKNKKIYGFNTDVYGALDSIKLIKKKNIAIYGFGGAGEAILRTLCFVYKKYNFLVISSKKKPHDLKKTKIKFIKKNKFHDLSNIDLFINCSPLGSNLRSKYRFKSPLTERLLYTAKKKLVIFDIVYKPKITKLNLISKKYGLKYINGLHMNTIQAELALKKIENYIIKSKRN